MTILNNESDTMKELKCELCGSNNLVKQGGLFVCTSCNAKYTVEEARKMMFENETNNETINNSELENLYTLARNALKSEDFHVAWTYYKQILLINPKDWEAIFYTVYCRTKNIGREEIISFEEIFIKIIPKFLTSIKNDILNENKQRETLEEIINRTIEMTKQFEDISKNYYNLELDENLRAEQKNVKDYVLQCGHAEFILYHFGNKLINLFGNKYSDLSVILWKKGVEYRMNRYPSLEVGANEETKEAISKILIYDPSYVAPSYQEPEMRRNAPKKKKGLFGRFK